MELDIQETQVQKNWWNNLPHFEPRVFDAILMEQARSCVNYIFMDLPDMHELENRIESNKNPNTSSFMKVSIPRTKVIKPQEITYDTPIDGFTDP